MKRIIVQLIVLMALISCTRTYNVMPKQTVIVPDSATLEKILVSDCFQSMSFTITVDDISVPKTVSTELSPRWR